MRRPNILVTIADDQRHDMVGCLGHPDLRTPTLDALASRGTLFSHAHHMGSTHGAVCAPSRAMLHTGLPLYRIPNAIKQNWGPFPAEASDPDPNSVPLLGELLRRAGYQCHGIGKWHNNPGPFMRSFDSGDLIFFEGMADPYATRVFRYNPAGDYPRDASFNAPGHCTESFADAAVRFIHDYAAGKRERPFFLYLGFTAPHDPRIATSRWHALYPAESVTLPGNFLPQHPFDNGELLVRDEKLAAFPRTESEIRKHIADYCAVVSHMDDALGRIHAALRETGLMDETLAVHTADHGLAVGRHGLMGKQNLYDHSVRVPLILAGPGVTPRRRDDRLCFQHDLFPTLLDAAGIRTPHAPERSPFRSLLSPPDATRDSVFTAYRECQRMVRDERFKLIACHVNGATRLHLFDLHADPLELRDLADDPAHRATLTRLRERLERWRRGVDDPAAWRA